MAYVKEVKAGPYSIVFFALFSAGALVMVVPVAIFAGAYALPYYGAIGMVWLVAAVVSVYFVRKGGSWYWEVNDEAVIMQFPTPLAGTDCNIRLDDVAEIRRQQENDSIHYYVIDRQGKQWWINESVGLDIDRFIREIQKRRAVPYRKE